MVWWEGGGRCTGDGVCGCCCHSVGVDSELCSLLGCVIVEVVAQCCNIVGVGSRCSSESEVGPAVLEIQRMMYRSARDRLAKVAVRGARYVQVVDAHKEMD